MRKIYFPLVTLVALALSNAAGAATLTLQAHNQRSSSGTLSTLKWSGCTTYTSVTPCINPANANLAAMGITPSTAVWDWNAGSGVLSMTGAFNSGSTLGSSGAAAASAVIGDKVTNMVIDTDAMTTTAATYSCGEGNFLAGVGAHGCANVGTGDDFVYNGSVAYNVGGDANCVNRTLGGDDVSTGNPRGLMSIGAGAGCDATDGGLNLWTVLSDTTATRGGQLVLSNGIDTAAPGTNYLTFVANPNAVDDGPFNALQEVALPIDVLENDTFFVDPVTVTVTTAATKGAAVVTGTSPGPQAGITITYTANAGATGADSFVYTVLDADGMTSDTATVTLNIFAGGANDDTAATTRNVGPISINVGANDVGFTDPVSITLEVGTDQGGTATPPADGAAATRAFSYTPATTAPGTPTYTETFTYRITDINELTATATVTVTVNNAVTVAGDLPLAISTAGSAPGSVTGSFNAATFAGNNPGNTPTTIGATNGTKGTTGIAGNVITYTPASTFFKGSDTFTYTLTDADPGTAETDTGTVTVTIADVSPTLADASITTAADTASAARALSYTLGNGSLAQHLLAVSTAAANGTCALTGTSLTYTPNAGHSGTDSCMVTLTDEDGDGQSDIGTFSITVTDSGGGGSSSGADLPGGSGSLDIWGLALLAGLSWLRRRHLRHATQGGRA